MHPGGTTRQGGTQNIGAEANNGDDEDDYNRLRGSREIAEEDDDDVEKRFHTVSAVGDFSERDRMKKQDASNKKQ